MSNKVNNLRKRIRVLEEQHAKQMKASSRRIARLESELEKRPSADNGAVVVRCRRETERPGKIYTYQFMIDLRHLEMMAFNFRGSGGSLLRPSGFVGEEVLFELERHVIEAMRKLFREYVLKGSESVVS